MLKNAVRFVRTFIDIFNGNRLTRAAAALSYYMTMTFFPVVIVLYTLLGNSYDKAMRIVAFAENLMAEETVSYIRDFLGYVAANNSTAMMIAGLTVLVTSASAAIRSMQFTIGDAQGGMRFQGIWGFIVSILISLLLIVAIYFGMLVMLTGRSVMNRLNELLPFIDISQSWNHMRFVILGGIMFLLIWGVYEYPKRKTDTYHTFPGAILSTLALVGVSIAFSVFIGASVKYSLVYGSLASIILLMMWLYTSSTVIYCGMALNLTIRDFKPEPRIKKTEETEQE